MHLGPVERRETGNIEGVRCGVQRVDPPLSARPVCPFPFRDDALLHSQAEKQRLVDVWVESDKLKERVTRRSYSRLARISHLLETPAEEETQRDVVEEEN